MLCRRSLHTALLSWRSYYYRKALYETRYHALYVKAVGMDQKGRENRWVRDMFLGLVLLSRVEEAHRESASCITRR